MIIPYSDEYKDFLRDESRKSGNAEYVSFPKNEVDIKSVINHSKSFDSSITIQGSRTGITAGAVPFGGVILNFSEMTKIWGLRYNVSDDCFYLRVEPGILLSNLTERLERLDFETKDWSFESLEALEKLKSSKPVCFPPDPTERTASIGGMIACNASGACSFYYGSVRKYVEGMRIVLSTGQILALKRGENFAKGYEFSLNTESKETLHGSIPKYEMPKTKNAAGFYCLEDMDLVDLFIGSEGTLGIISEAELKLVTKPEFVCAMTLFFPEEENALKFVSKVKSLNRENEGTTNIVAIEYFNSKALSLMRKVKKENDSFSEIPQIKESLNTAIYLEIHSESEDAAFERIEAICEVFPAYGANEEDSWFAQDKKELSRMHFFRHAVPEIVNMTIDEYSKNTPELTKLGTDMAVPDSQLQNIVDLYNKTLQEADLDWVMFGHIGDNHIHVNILPKNMNEFNKAKELYRNWAHHVIKLGGTISAEHGIGKLKKDLFNEVTDENALLQMKEIKKLFDPNGILSKGNLI